MTTDIGRSDPYFTPNGLVRYQKRVAPDTPPVGADPIRRAAKRGDLTSIRTGKWFRIRLSDFYDWLEDMQVESEPSVEDRVEQRVKIQLSQDSRLRRG